MEYYGIVNPKRYAIVRAQGIEHRVYDDGVIETYDRTYQTWLPTIQSKTPVDLSVVRDLAFLYLKKQ